MSATICCRHCGVEVPAADYERHALAAHNVRVFACVGCALGYETAAGLASHTERHHPAPPPAPGPATHGFYGLAPLDRIPMRPETRQNNARRREEEVIEAQQEQLHQAAQFWVYQAGSARERALRQRGTDEAE